MGRILLPALVPVVLGCAAFAMAAAGAGLSLRSSAFAADGAIPKLYTCVDRNVSPPLAWSGAPAGTRSLALVADDPDAPDPKAPKMTWVHWVVVDIPPAVQEIPEAASGTGRMPPGARELTNDFKQAKYGGPCPPVGRHRYYFKLYALDTTLPSLAKGGKPELEAAMKGHVLAQATLMGTFQKS